MSKRKHNPAPEPQGSEGILSVTLMAAEVASDAARTAETPVKVVEAAAVTVLPTDAPMTLAIRWLSAMARTIIGRVSAATGTDEGKIHSDILIGYPPSNAAVSTQKMDNGKNSITQPPLYYVLTPGKHNRLAVDDMRPKVWLHPGLNTPTNTTAALYVGLVAVALPPVAYQVDKGPDKGKVRWRSSEKRKEFREALNALGFSPETIKDAPRIIAPAGKLLERDIRDAIIKVNAECGEYPAEAVNAMFDPPVLRASRNVVVYCPIGGTIGSEDTDGKTIRPGKDTTHLILRMTAAEAITAGLTDVPQLDGKLATTPFPCPKCAKAGAHVALTTHLDDLQIAEWTRVSETADAKQTISDQSGDAVKGAAHTLDAQLGALNTTTPGDAVAGQ